MCRVSIRDGIRVASVYDRELLAYLPLELLEGMVFIKNRVSDVPHPLLINIRIKCNSIAGIRNTGYIIYILHGTAIVERIESIEE